MSRVSVIIGAFSPKTKTFLDACVSAALKLDYPDYEVVIVSPKSYAPQYAGVRTVSPEGEDYPLAHNINFGFQQADPRSEMLFFINDDCVPTASCLGQLERSLRLMPQVGLLMPISNDQNLGAYSLMTPIQGPYKADQLRPGLMSESASVYPPGLIMRDTLCLFAFLIRREVFEKVGLWDTQLLGMDDVDYSWRMRQAGYLNAIELSALCYHAGGATTHDKPEAWRRESERIFNEKWGGR